MAKPACALAAARHRPARSKMSSLAEGRAKRASAFAVSSSSARSARTTTLVDASRMSQAGCERCPTASSASAPACAPRLRDIARDDVPGRGIRPPSRCHATAARSSRGRCPGFRDSSGASARALTGRLAARPSGSQASAGQRGRWSTRVRTHSATAAGRASLRHALWRERRPWPLAPRVLARSPPGAAATVRTATARPRKPGWR